MRKNNSVSVKRGCLNLNIVVVIAIFNNRGKKHNIIFDFLDILFNLNILIIDCPTSRRAVYKPNLITIQSERPATAKPHAWGGDGALAELLNNHHYEKVNLKYFIPLYLLLSHCRRGLFRRLVICIVLRRATYRGN